MFFCLRLNFLLFFPLYFSQFSAEGWGKMVALSIYLFFFPAVSLFEGFWCLHSLKKRFEMWQG